MRNTKKKTVAAKAKPATKEQMASFDHLKKTIQDLQYKRISIQEESDRLYKDACEVNNAIKGLEALLPKCFH